MTNLDTSIEASRSRARRWNEEAQKPVGWIGDEEGDRCSFVCDGTLYIPDVEGCLCHLNAPCTSCVTNYPRCRECGRVAEPEDRAPSALPTNAGRWRSLGVFGSEWVPSRPSRDLGDGKRIFDFDYDSSSGSTMEWKGSYEGPVTAADIIAAFGDGTFGHRGPMLHNGRFTYTQITD